MTFARFKEKLIFAQIVPVTPISVFRSSVFLFLYRIDQTGSFPFLSQLNLRSAINLSAEPLHDKAIEFFRSSGVALVRKFLIFSLRGRGRERRGERQSNDQCPRFEALDISNVRSRFTITSHSWIYANAPSHALVSRPIVGYCRIPVIDSFRPPAPRGRRQGCFCHYRVGLVVLDVSKA